MTKEGPSLGDKLRPRKLPNAAAKAFLSCIPCFEPDCLMWQIMRPSKGVGCDTAGVDGGPAEASADTRRTISGAAHLAQQPWGEETTKASFFTVRVDDPVARVKKFDNQHLKAATPQAATSPLLPQLSVPHCRTLLLAS